MTDLLQAKDESQALELLHSRGLTDGLPVVIPTPDRVARLVLATGLDADLLLGEMGPGNGAATVAVDASTSTALPAANHTHIALGPGR